MTKLPQSRGELRGDIGVAVMRKGRASLAQAAKLLSSDVSTVEHRILQGELEAVKINGRWKIPVHALKAAGAALPNPQLIEGAKGLQPIDSNPNPEDSEAYYD